MQARLWSGVVACAVAAVASGLAHARRHRRTDPDRVGFMPWQTVQFAAMMGALILASVALNS